MEIIEKSSTSYEKHHNVIISKSAIEACVKLSKKYINDKQLPDKAFDILDEACSKKSLELSSLKKAQEDMLAYERDCNWEKISEIKYSILPKLTLSSNEVTEKDIADLIATKTSIPVAKITEDERVKLANIESHLCKRVIGQDEAITSIANMIRARRLGLNESNISFLFTGGSGVGKTETAKALAEYLFSSEDSLLRFDMSEYQEKHSISKLIGAPAGYVGYEEGGRLTEAVRRKPFQVILFDEVEKAHPDIYDTLLQVLDDGILTDSLGREVSFKNTIIVMTSNLKEDGLKKFFRVEFLNRLNSILHFKPLTKEDIEKIALSKLYDLSDKIKEENDILIDFSKGVLSKLVDMAYKPEYGARELNRIIDNMIKIPLANKIVKGELEKDRLFIFQ